MAPVRTPKKVSSGVSPYQSSSPGASASRQPVEEIPQSSSSTPNPAKAVNQNSGALSWLLELRDARLAREQNSPPREFSTAQVCNKVTEFGDFNWPDVRKLCYLLSDQVSTYETSHWWVTVGLEPLLKQTHRFKSNAGYQWDSIFYHFEKRNPWNRITAPRTLAEMYNRHRGTLKMLINQHNNLVRGKTIKERIQRTVRFLRLKREQPKSEMETVDEINVKPKITLVPVEFDLVVWYWKTTADGSQELVKFTDPAPKSLNGQVLLLPPDDGVPPHMVDYRVDALELVAQWEEEDAAAAANELANAEEEVVVEDSSDDESEVDSEDSYEYEERRKAAEEWLDGVLAREKSEEEEEEEDESEVEEDTGVYEEYINRIVYTEEL